MSAIVQRNEPEAAALPTGTITQAIIRLAQDPTLDLDRFERLVVMQERAEARQAEKAFTAALSAMQPNLPVVTQNGTIVIRDKNNPKTIIQETPFARWEDINEAIAPHLAEHGFSLSFRAERDGDRVVVRGILSHRDGHKEETTLPLALDTSGSKNNVQAVGSSISYGKRYTAGMLLNITSRAANEADDNGMKAGSQSCISDDQIETIQSMIVQTASDIQKFYGYFKIDTLTDLPSARFNDAVNMLQAKARRGSK